MMAQCYGFAIYQILVLRTTFLSNKGSGVFGQMCSFTTAFPTGIGEVGMKMKTQEHLGLKIAVHAI